MAAADTPADTFYDTAPYGLCVRVRLHPAARRTDVTGLAADADGRLALKASVTQVPEGGKANRALLKMLAKEWDVAKSDLDVIQGLTGRAKVVRLRGKTTVLAARLDAWAGGKGLNGGV